MFHKTPTTSAELYTEQPTESQKGSETEYYKGQAFICFKQGCTKVGKLYLEDALKAAKQEGKIITLEEINHIMEGKVPPKSETKENPRSPSSEKQEKKEKTDISQKSEDVRTQVLKLFEPLKEEFITFIKEIIKAIRQEFNIFQYFRPKQSPIQYRPHRARV
jgi:hypothetical protein